MLEPTGLLLVVDSFAVLCVEEPAALEVVSLVVWEVRNVESLAITGVASTSDVV